MIGKTNAKAESGIDTSDATATAADLIYGKTAYVDGAKIIGDGGYWQHSTGIGFYNSIGLQGDVVIFAPNVLSLASSFAGCVNILTVKIWTGLITTFLSNTFSGCSKLTSIELNVNTSSATNFASTFNNCASLKTISGSPINLSAATTVTNMFSNCPKLEVILFSNNSLKIGLSLSQSPLLTTTSLISIANGLNATTPNVLTMHATSKTNMNNILVDNVAGVAVLGSAMTLTAFINNIKGWTIA